MRHVICIDMCRYIDTCVYINMCRYVMCYVFAVIQERRWDALYVMWYINMCRYVMCYVFAVIQERQWDALYVMWYIDMCRYVMCYVFAVLQERRWDALYVTAPQMLNAPPAIPAQPDANTKTPCALSNASKIHEVRNRSRPKTCNWTKIMTQGHNALPKVSLVILLAPTCHRLRH